MVVEMRTYRIKIGATPAFMKVYQEKGLKVQTRILGHLVGWYTSEFGELNQVIHMWAYKDLNDRAERRKKLFQDPEWLAYLAESRQYVEHQENKLLNPAPWMKLPEPV